MARSLIVLTFCLSSCLAFGQQVVNLNQQGKQDFLADFPVRRTTRSEHKVGRRHDSRKR